MTEYRTPAKVALWREKMYERFGLDDKQLDAWLRLGMSHRQIEDWWAAYRRDPSIVLDRQVTFYAENGPYNTSGVVTVTEPTLGSAYKGIAGRHFASAMPQLKFNGGDVNLLLEVDQAMATDDVAAVTLSVVLNGCHWNVDGSAKRDPSDRPNQEIGLALATARALQRLSQQVMRQANGQVKHADWIELDHQARRREHMSVAKLVGPKKTAKKARKARKAAKKKAHA